MIIEAKPIDWRPPSPSQIRANTNWYTIKGREYERLLYEYLSQNGEYTIRNQWFQYKTDKEDKVRRCQIDIILFNRKVEHISVTESKLSYGMTSGAYMKMKEIYIPVAKKAFDFERVGGTIIFLENLTQGKIVHSSIEEATEWSIKNRDVAFMYWKPEKANWHLRLQSDFHDAKYALKHVTQ